MRNMPFRVIRIPGEGVEAVEAETARTFDRHTHEQFGVGLVVHGAQRSASGRGTGMPLAEAALNSGFSDQSHMTRRFVGSFGYSPGVYARMPG
jgi:AraC-like DNA-binding protein